MTIPRKLVSVKEACSYLGIKTTKFYELIAAESVETLKIGCRRLVVLESLDRLIATSSSPSDRDPDRDHDARAERTM